MNSYTKNIALQTVVWTCSLIYFTMLRQYGQELVNEPIERSLLEQALLFLTLGLIWGATFATFDKVLDRRLKSIKSFGMSILVRSSLYLVLFIFLTIIGIVLFTLQSSNDINIDLVSGFLFSKEGILIISYLFLTSFLLQFVKHVDKKFGPGNLFRMLKGEFHSPKEVERIVMFLDLKSSTTIAERIGHKKYSQFIQACFDDLNIVEKFNAEIYQYIGDEVVLVWEPFIGLKNENFIEFFFTYRHLLESKSEYFNANFGFLPEFKCGCHLGTVVMTEIGQIKREIAYHGDVMNSAARIQSQCNKYDKDFLLSESLFKMIGNINAYNFQHMSSAKLKGKENDIKIYSVEKDS